MSLASPASVTSRAWRLRAVDLLCVAAAALLLPSTPWGHPSVVGFALLVVAIGFSNTALIHVTVARQRVSFTLTEGLIAGAYLMSPGSWIIVPAVVGLIPMLVINKSSALKVQHNVAQYIVATAVASYVVNALNNTIPACIVGMAAWWVASQIMSAIPLSIMSGEGFAKMICDQFDVLYKEGAKSGRVMAIALHPYLIGVPHRIGAFDAALKYICKHKKVWKATGSEIAEHYLAQFGGGKVASKSLARERAERRAADRAGGRR